MASLVYRKKKFAALLCFQGCIVVKKLCQGVRNRYVLPIKTHFIDKVKPCWVVPVFYFYLFARFFNVAPDVAIDTIQYFLQITYIEPGLKGDTATNTLTPAEVETGAKIRVPLFIKTGDIVKINTETGDYMERVKA